MANQNSAMRVHLRSIGPGSAGLSASACQQGNGGEIAPNESRAGVRVVLVSPKRGANVGAACRAIKNMGGGSLFVIGGDYDADEARRTSVHAADVFDARLAVATFDEAVATASLVIGTSPRERPWSIPVEEVGAVFAQASQRGLEASDVALVFGPEDRGLSNEELARCHRVAFVPTAGEYASLNLAQAVVICLYEWLQVSRGARREPASRDGGAVQQTDVSLAATADVRVAATAGDSVAPATASAQTAALDDLRAVLEGIGFLDGDQGDRVMATLASMLTRGGLDEREVSILRGLARQIRWAARTGGKPSLHGR